MRGTLHVTGGDAWLLGIIPAYAGNTTSTGAPLPLTRDHPRVCGEHLVSMGSGALPLGSSPRMRGTPPLFRGQQRRRGIIPAYAGNTCRTRSADSTSRDHPRVCGEHMLEIEAVGEIRGSSPRMRGTRVVADNYGLAVGIIPAYAGNTRA